MNRNDDNLRLLFGRNQVHLILYQWNKRFELHSGPEFLIQPGLHVRIGKSQYGYLHSMPFQDTDTVEIRLSIRLDCIACEKWNTIGLQIRCNTVIDIVPCLYVMISDTDSVIFHISRKARKKVRCDSVHIIIIVRRIVALQAVAGIDKYDIINAKRISISIDISIHGHQRRAPGAIHISRVEPRAMHVISSKQVELEFACRSVAARCGSEHCGRCGSKYFRYIVHVK